MPDGGLGTMGLRTEAAGFSERRAEARAAASSSRCCWRRAFSIASARSTSRALRTAAAFSSASRLAASAAAAAASCSARRRSSSAARSTSVISNAVNNSEKKAPTGLDPLLLLEPLLLPPLLLLDRAALLLALGQERLPPLRLLLLDLPTRRILLLRILLALLCDDYRSPRFVLAYHPCKALLRLQILLVRAARGVPARALHRDERLAVGRLLLRVVLREQRALLFAVRALDVVDALGNDAQALRDLLLLLLELRDLQPDDALRVQRANALCGGIPSSAPAPSK